ncbi:hypothetical protein [Planctobacterium marinum]
MASKVINTVISGLMFSVFALSSQPVASDTYVEYLDRTITPLPIGQFALFTYDTTARTRSLTFLSDITIDENFIESFELAPSGVSYSMDNANHDLTKLEINSLGKITVSANLIVPSANVSLNAASIVFNSGGKITTTGRAFANHESDAAGLDAPISGSVSLISNHVTFAESEIAIDTSGQEGQSGKSGVAGHMVEYNGRISGHFNSKFGDLIDSQNKLTESGKDALLQDLRNTNIEINDLVSEGNENYFFRPSREHFSDIQNVLMYVVCIIRPNQEASASYRSERRYPQPDHIPRRQDGEMDAIDLNDRNGRNSEKYFHNENCKYFEDDKPFPYSVNSGHRDYRQAQPFLIAFQNSRGTPFQPHGQSANGGDIFLPANVFANQSLLSKINKNKGPLRSQRDDLIGAAISFCMTTGIYRTNDGPSLTFKDTFCLKPSANIEDNDPVNEQKDGALKIASVEFSTAILLQLNRYLNHLHLNGQIEQLNDAISSFETYSNDRTLPDCSNSQNDVDLCKASRALFDNLKQIKIQIAAGLNPFNQPWNSLSRFRLADLNNQVSSLNQAYMQNNNLRVTLGRLQKSLTQQVGRVEAEENDNTSLSIDLNSNLTELRKKAEELEKSLTKLEAMQSQLKSYIDERTTEIATEASQRLEEEQRKQRYRLKRAQVLKHSATLVIGATVSPALAGTVITAVNGLIDRRSTREIRSGIVEGLSNFAIDKGLKTISSYEEELKALNDAQEMLNDEQAELNDAINSSTQGGMVEYDISVRANGDVEALQKARQQESERRERARLRRGHQADMEQSVKYSFADESRFLKERKKEIEDKIKKTNKAKSLLQENTPKMKGALQGLVESNNTAIEPEQDALDVDLGRHFNDIAQQDEEYQRRRQEYSDLVETVNRISNELSDIWNSVEEHINRLKQTQIQIYKSRIAQILWREKLSHAQKVAILQDSVIDNEGLERRAKIAAENLRKAQIYLRGDTDIQYTDLISQVSNLCQTDQLNQPENCMTENVLDIIEKLNKSFTAINMANGDHEYTYSLANLRTENSRIIFEITPKRNVSCNYLEVVSVQLRENFPFGSNAELRISRSRAFSEGDIWIDLEESKSKIIQYRGSEVTFPSFNERGYLPVNARSKVVLEFKRENADQEQWNHFVENFTESTVRLITGRCTNLN